MANTSPTVEIPATTMTDPLSGQDEVPPSQPEIQSAVEHDQNYYFEEDPMAIFLVEKRLFKVHRHFLSEESEVFRNMFASPIEGGCPEGTTDKGPVLFPGVTANEFKALLDYFYLPLHRKWDFSSKEDKLQVYLDLLSISHRFLFDGVLQFAVKSIQPMLTDIPAIQRYVLGVKYDLREWLLSSYEGLLDSETTPSAHELEILGFEKTARLMQARNAMHQQRLKYLEVPVRACQPPGPIESQTPRSPKSKGRTIREATLKLSSALFVQQYFE